MSKLFNCFVFVSHNCVNFWICCLSSVDWISLLEGLQFDALVFVIVVRLAANEEPVFVWIGLRLDVFLSPIDATTPALMDKNDSKLIYIFMPPMQIIL